MEQRAAVIGGSLRVDSRLRDGTRVTVDVPLAGTGRAAP
jgi:signal transduction histidine kinase